MSNKAPKLLVSSDLNGTLVHQHTMGDMIRLYRGEEQFEEANAVFKMQTSGTATMEEAFGTAGPLTKGLTLRQAVQYTQEHMRYVDGFDDFLGFLRQNGMPLVINSTGYSVTIYSIIGKVGAEKVHGQIGNFLKFGLDGDCRSTLTEAELRTSVRLYFANLADAYFNETYDRIQATGEIELGIVDEAAKAGLITKYAKHHFPGMASSQIVHMGDTMGDSGGILGVAQAGGVGIAFNYNEALENFLRERGSSALERLHFVDKKGLRSNLTKIIPILEDLVIGN